MACACPLSSCESASRRGSHTKRLRIGRTRQTFARRAEVKSFGTVFCRRNYSRERGGHTSNSQTTIDPIAINWLWGLGTCLQTAVYSCTRTRRNPKALFEKFTGVVSLEEVVHPTFWFHHEPPRTTRCAFVFCPKSAFHSAALPPKSKKPRAFSIKGCHRRAVP